MPVAFIYNRRIELDVANGFFDEVLFGKGYRRVGSCVSLSLILNDIASGKASEVGIAACSVVPEDTEVTDGLPFQIENTRAVLAVAPRAHLPEAVATTNVVKVNWGREAQDVFQCLLSCARWLSDSGSKTGKRHAGGAQHILTRELQSLRDAVRPGFCTRPPFEQVISLLGEHARLSEWPEPCKWMTEPFVEPRLLYDFNMPWTAELVNLFPVLRVHLKSLLLNLLRGCQIRYV